MHKITFKGSGQLNGVVPINKTIEIDDQLLKGYTGQNRNDVILSTLAIHYPGVKINPGNIGLNIEKVKEVTKAKATKVVKNKESIQSTQTNQSNAIPINNQLDNILEIEYNNNENDIRQKLDFIFVQLSKYKWTTADNDIEKENNEILNQCLLQYRIGFDRLKSQTNDLKVLNLHKKQLAKLRMKKILGAYWKYLLILFCILAGTIASLFTK